MTVVIAWPQPAAGRGRGHQAPHEIGDNGIDGGIQPHEKRSDTEVAVTAFTATESTGGLSEFTRLE